MIIEVPDKFHFILLSWSHSFVEDMFTFQGFMPHIGSRNSTSNMEYFSLVPKVIMLTSREPSDEESPCPEGRSPLWSFSFQPLIFWLPLLPLAPSPEGWPCYRAVQDGTFSRWLSSQKEWGWEREGHTVLTGGCTGNVTRRWIWEQPLLLSSLLPVIRTLSLT